MLRPVAIRLVGDTQQWCLLLVRIQMIRDNLNYARGKHIRDQFVPLLLQRLAVVWRLGDSGDVVLVAPQIGPSVL